MRCQSVFLPFSDPVLMDPAGTRTNSMSMLFLYIASGEQAPRLSVTAINNYVWADPRLCPGPFGHHAPVHVDIRSGHKTGFTAGQEEDGIRDVFWLAEAIYGMCFGHL